MTRLKGNGGCSLKGIRGSSKAALRHLREGTSEMVRVAWTENFIHHPKERWTELQLWFVDTPEKAHEFAAREDWPSEEDEEAWPDRPRGQFMVNFWINFSGLPSQAAYTDTADNPLGH